MSILNSYSQFLMLLLTIVKNFVKLSYLENTFLETSYLSVLGLCGPMIHRPDDLSQPYVWFRASLWYLTSGKNFMVVRPAVSEILGGGFPSPQMLLSFQKEQMLLTINSAHGQLRKQDCRYCAWSSANRIVQIRYAKKTDR